MLLSLSALSSLDLILILSVILILIRVSHCSACSCFFFCVQQNSSCIQHTQLYSCIHSCIQHTQLYSAYNTAVFSIHSCMQHTQLYSAYTAVFSIHSCVQHSQLCSAYTAVFSIHCCVQHTQLYTADTVVCQCRTHTSSESRLPQDVPVELDSPRAQYRGADHLRHGRAEQVDPVNPSLKAPGTMCLNWNLMNSFQVLLSN